MTYIVRVVGESLLSASLTSDLDSYSAISFWSRSYVCPCVIELNSLVDPVKKDLHNLMAEKLTAADSTFKDSVNKLVNSQVTVSAMDIKSNTPITHVLYLVPLP